MVKISDIKMKEVINISDGRRLGIVNDVEINMDTGCIEAVIIPGTGKLLGFFSKESDIVVNWSSIVKMGVDVILVEGNGY